MLRLGSMTTGHVKQQYSRSDEAHAQEGTGNIHPSAVCPQGQRPRAAVDHGPPRTPQARPSVAPNSVSHLEPGQTKPGNSWLGGTTGQKQAEHVCFGCGKVGHIQINCPYKKAKPRTAAAACIQQEENSGTTRDVAPVDAQEGENPPEDEDAKQEYFLLSEEDLP